MPPTDTVRPSRVWYWYWDSPSSLVIYWKAWDEEFQSKVVLVSLKDTVSTLASIQLHYIKPMSFIPFQWLQKKKLSGSRRKDAQQFLSVGDVRHCRLCAVEEVQENVAGVSSAAVDLLCRLLGKTAHHPLHPANKTEVFTVRGGQLGRGAQFESFESESSLRKYFNGWRAWN